jgi:asparagine synthase (glutamine-hydrolysing)
MCGIAGIVNLTGEKADERLLERMCGRLVHRGPDGAGFFTRGPVALGQRRLSIIDLAGGRQPMSNEDGTVWVTFNGEIYNFRELRAWLEGCGHRFATQSDTEVIVHAYEELGPACVDRFRGMFAFAVWDDPRQELFAARDRVGKKPLFYTTVGGQFLFASELQAILEHPAVDRIADPVAIDEFLTYGYVPGPRTGFQGVHKLLPAHYLTLRRKPGGDWADVRVERYWQLEYGPKLALREEEAAEALLEVLTEATRLRLVADVPIGALLSGGVDSSIVVALMSRLSDRPVKSFSIGFEEQGFNELPHARRVAWQYGTEHHEFIVRPNALEILPTLVRHYGEPYADSSAIPSYYVSQMTRQHVTVALNGDGGDEVFGGYERYLASALADRYQKLPSVIRRGVLQPLAALIPDTLPRRNRLRQTKRFLQKAELPLARRYLGWINYFTREQKGELYSGEFRDRLGACDAESWLLGLFDQVGSTAADPLDVLLAVDVRSYLPYDLLVKMDIATMANSLEARSPLLDHRVMEFAARLPADFKVRGRTLKYLLKEVGKKLLPPENLSRRKMGFGVPVGQWMRGDLRPLVEDVLLSGDALRLGYFEPDKVRKLVRAHLEGTRDYSSQLWALLCLELWQREFAVTG